MSLHGRNTAGICLKCTRITLRGSLNPSRENARNYESVLEKFDEDSDLGLLSTLCFILTTLSQEEDQSLGLFPIILSSLVAELDL